MFTIFFTGFETEFFKRYLFHLFIPLLAVIVEEAKALLKNKWPRESSFKLVRDFGGYIVCWEPYDIKSLGHAHCISNKVLEL